MTTMTESTTKKEPGRLAVILAYFLIYVVWGSTYYFIGVALRGFPPFLLGGLRFSAAGILLLTFSRIRREGIFRGGLIRKSAVSGIILLFIDMAVIMLAQQYLSSSLVAILASSTVIWIMALDIPMWKTNFRLPAVSIGIVTGFLGVGLLFLEQLFHGGKNVHHEYGVVLLVVGCISWALGTLYAKYKSSSEEEVNDFAGAAWQMLFASAMFWLCAIVNGDVEEADLSTVSSTSWFSLLYLISFGSLLAYSAYVWLLKVRPAAEVGTHAYVNPFIAVLLGVFLGNERVTFIRLSGLLVILLGVMLINRKRLTGKTGNL